MGWAPGWYPDPNGRPVHRWWDGVGWSHLVHAGGQVIDESIPNPALQAFAYEPVIVYHETQPGIYGGRIDLLNAGGGFLGWSASDRPSRSDGWLQADVHIDLFDARGFKAGTLIRQTGDHPVFDGVGSPVGAFKEPGIFSSSVRVETGGSIVARLNTSQKDAWLLGADQQPLAHVYRKSSVAWSISLRDTYTLEMTGPMPSWLLLFAILSPIEANLRNDARRSARHESDWHSNSWD